MLDDDDEPVQFGSRGRGDPVQQPAVTAPTPEEIETRLVRSRRPG
jgi:hypothetical protein